MGCSHNSHDTNYLQAIPGEELSHYIDICTSRAFREGRDTYRRELQQGLEAQAKCMSEGQTLRIPLPRPVRFTLGEAPSIVAERLDWVEFTPDQIRAFSQFLTGVRA